MRAEPQAASYRPDTPIETLADWIGDAVEPADFPKTELRFRNERHAATVGLEDLS
ncbi:MAG TPA: selenoprotein O, partial [Erythrobacter sp.]|nr:selenoprotein O [Erythrobacter sp.]